MKKLVLLLLCAAGIIAAAPMITHADTGPKPSVVIDFKGLENQTYFITLLSSTESTGPFSAIKNGNSTRYQLGDKNYDIFLKFAAYSDEDRFYFLQFFEDSSQTQQFKWGYYPPQTFKILLYFPAMDSFIVSAECYERYAFDSYFTVSVSDFNTQATTLTTTLSTTQSTTASITSSATVSATSVTKTSTTSSAAVTTTQSTAVSTESSTDMITTQSVAVTTIPSFAVSTLPHEMIVEKSYDYAHEARGLAVRILLTILIELGVLLLFGFREKKQIYCIILVNIVTQIALNLALFMIGYRVGNMAFVFFYVLLELAVFAGEGILYAWWFKKHSETAYARWKPWIYALVANAASFVAGIGLAQLFPAIF